MAAEAHGAPTYTCALVEPCLSFMFQKHVLLAKSVVDPTDRVAAIVNENSDKHISHHLTDVWAGLRGTSTGEQVRITYRTPTNICGFQRRYCSN